MCRRGSGWGCLNARGSPQLCVTVVQRARIGTQVDRRSGEWRPYARGPSGPLGGGALVLGQLLGLPGGVVAQIWPSVLGEQVTMAAGQRILIAFMLLLLLELQLLYQILAEQLNI